MAGCRDVKKMGQGWRGEVVYGHRRGFCGPGVSGAAEGQG